MELSCKYNNKSVKSFKIGLPIGRQNDSNSSFKNNYESVKNLAEQMEYFIEQRNGQRIFGPPLNWTEASPSRECEIFIGCIARDVFEDVLVPILSTAGTLYQLRLMMDFSGCNRGFAFAMYSCVEEALEACRILNKHQISPEKYLAVSMCRDNNAIYIGGIPKKEPCVIIYAICSHTLGLTQVSVTVPDNYGKSYVVARYANHKAAALARRNLQIYGYKIWDTKSQVIVDWYMRHHINIPVSFCGFYAKILKFSS